VTPFEQPRRKSSISCTAGESPTSFAILAMAAGKARPSRNKMRKAVRTALISSRAMPARFMPTRFSPLIELKPC
jgi:hypothetical protein